MAFILAGPTQEIRRGQDEHGNRLNTYQVLYLKGIHASHAGADSTTIHLPLCLSLSAEWTTTSHQKTSVRKASSVLDICWQSTVSEGI